MGCGLPAISLPPKPQAPSGHRGTVVARTPASCTKPQLQSQSPRQATEVSISLPASHSSHQENTNLQWLPVKGKKILTGKTKPKATPLSNLHARSQATKQPPQRKAQTMQCLSWLRINTEILSEKNQTRRQSYPLVFENI